MKNFSLSFQFLFGKKTAERVKDVSHFTKVSYLSQITNLLQVALLKNSRVGYREFRVHIGDIQEI